MVIFIIYILQGIAEIGYEEACHRALKTYEAVMSELCQKLVEKIDSTHMIAEKHALEDFNSCKKLEEKCVAERKLETLLQV